MFSVTSTNDSGPGSLRQAILDGNANRGSGVVSFSIPTPGKTISLTTALSAVLGPLFIDGSTQPGFMGTALIEVSGAGVPGAGQDGFRLRGGQRTVSKVVMSKRGVELA
ncbi:MAG: hypothetical protein FJ405_04950 [Verrucomicrobia bacterium]|nr:hypothetical protein [Verrucomicrobiota bacterium]